MSTVIKQMLGSVVIFSKIGFINCFVSVIKLRLRELGQIVKTFLLLDNCFAHPNEDKFILMAKILQKFLPPNVTPLLQPMDKVILESLKRAYRKLILRDLVLQSTFSIRDF